MSTTIASWRALLAGAAALALCGCDESPGNSTRDGRAASDARPEAALADGAPRDAAGDAPGPVGDAATQDARADGGTTPSTHEVKVVLPPCSKSDPQVKLISSDADFKAINDAQKRVFCVLPGTYSGNDITLSAGGTAAKPRYLRYHDPAKPGAYVHPVKMSESKRAVVKRKLEAGQHWVIDGLTLRADSKGSMLTSTAGGESVFNRLLIEGGGGGGGQVQLKSNNVLQNSVLRKTMIVSGSDFHCVVIGAGSGDLKVVNNEIYDCAGDGIQLHPGKAHGVVVANNDIYQSAGFSAGENGIDIKATGGSKPSEWIRFEDNRLWGIDSKGGTGGTPGSFDFSEKTLPKSYLLFEGNIVTDAVLAFTTGGGGAVSRISLVRNLFYQATTGIQLNDVSASEVYYNTVIGVTSWIDPGWGKATSIDIRCNVLIDAKDRGDMGTGTQADYNAYYNAKRYAAPGTHDVVKSAAAEAKGGQYCFLRRQWTGPEKRCVPHALTASGSPHAALCAKAAVGARAGVGVDDKAYTQGKAGFVPSP